MRVVQLGAAFAAAMAICGPASAAIVYSVSSETSGDSPLFFTVPADTELYVQMTADPAFKIPEPFYYYELYYYVYRPDYTFDYANNSPMWFDLNWAFDGQYYTTSFQSGGTPYYVPREDGGFAIDSQKEQRFYWDNYYQIQGGGAWSLTVSDTPFGAVPEPATWAMMIAGLGLAGVGLRSVGSPWPRAELDKARPADLSGKLDPGAGYATLVVTAGLVPAIHDREGLILA